MTLQNEKYNCYYDEQYDDLTIRKKNTTSTTASEIYDDIYVYKDSKDVVIGAQILFYKNRARTILKQYLPPKIFKLLKELGLRKVSICANL